MAAFPPAAFPSNTGGGLLVIMEFEVLSEVLYSDSAGGF